jgi:hypothetical protein
VLKWARENGCHWDALTCERAAAGGHLEVLQWARQHDCPWFEGTCQAAAAGGYLEVLKWAREHHCEWGEWQGLTLVNFSARLKHFVLDSGCA